MAMKFCIANSIGIIFFFYSSVHSILSKAISKIANLLKKNIFFSKTKPMFKKIRYYLLYNIQNCSSAKFTNLLIWVLACFFYLVLLLTQKYDPKLVNMILCERFFSQSGICLFGFDQSILYFQGRLYPIYSLGQKKVFKNGI
jgi:hypothetical protein